MVMTTCRRCRDIPTDYWLSPQMDTLIRGSSTRWRTRRRSSRAPMPRYITRAIPRCIMFSIRCIIGNQRWTPPSKQSARPVPGASGPTDEGKTLNFDFNPASQKEFLLPRQRYGIDLYGVHNGKWNACARRSRIGSSSHAASRMSYVWIMPQSSCNELFGKYVNT